MAFIARALASEPEILVMDEPESHLDFKNQHFILDLIVKLSRNRGLSCIINTHYPDHALRISDKTLLLGDNVCRFGDTSQILTEKRIKEFFDVNAKIANVEHNGNIYKTFCFRRKGQLRFGTIAKTLGCLYSFNCCSTIVHYIN